MHAHVYYVIQRQYRNHKFVKAFGKVSFRQNCDVGHGKYCILILSSILNVIYMIPCDCTVLNDVKITTDVRATNPNRASSGVSTIWKI